VLLIVHPRRVHGRRPSTLGENMRRASYQSQADLAGFYKELSESNEKIPAGIGWMMMELLPVLDSRLQELAVSGLTSHCELRCLARDDKTSPWYVGIQAFPDEAIASRIGCQRVKRRGRMRACRVSAVRWQVRRIWCGWLAQSPGVGIDDSSTSVCAEPGDDVSVPKRYAGFRTRFSRLRLLSRAGSLQRWPIKRGIQNMMDKVLIRSETSADVSAIAEVTVAAFKTLAISNHTEQFIIAALRAAKALTVSLVAEVDGRVVGHIAFSPVTISDGSLNWYGLGPVSVLPECQRRGIGRALTQEGISRLKDLGARGCCLVGHPEYYRRFGFQNIRGLVHEGVPEEVFFTLSLDGHIPQGIVEFHVGFKADGQQEGAGDALPART
jgi:putative acetyltransferase